MESRNWAALGLIVLMILAPDSGTWALVVPSPDIELGYGPSFLLPSSQGTPVYVSGDQLWVRSDYPAPVNLTVFPASSQISTPVSFIIPPSSPVMIHSFTASDYPGYWLVRANVSSFAEYFMLAPPSSSTGNLSITGSGLSGPVLRANFSSSSAGPIYEAEACLTRPITEVPVAVPQPLGGGKIQLNPEGGGLGLSWTGRGNQTFNIWTELYHSYSILVQGTGSVFVERDVRVAFTEGGLVSGRNGTLVLPWVSDIPWRTGRYQLRVNFENGAGSYVVSSRVLVNGTGGWFPLGGCPSSAVISGNFSLTSTLGEDPASWPTRALLMYKDQGVEGFAMEPLGFQVAQVRFLSSPWSVPLADYSISSSQLGGIRAASGSNGSLYLLLESDFASTNYTLSLGGRVLYAGSVYGIRGLTASEVDLNASRLTVTVYENGTVAEGIRVSLSDAGGTLESKPTGRDGTATFYVPAGNYTLSASIPNATRISANVSVGLRGTASVVLGRNTQGQSTPLLFVALSAGAIVGSVLNLLVFLVRRRQAQGSEP